MEIWEGKSVFGGIAIGPIALFSKEEDPVKRYSIEDTEKEKERFEKAKQSAKNELAGLYEKALKEISRKKKTESDGLKYSALKLE